MCANGRDAGGRTKHSSIPRLGDHRCSRMRSRAERSRLSLAEGEIAAAAISPAARLNLLRSARERILEQR